MKLRIFYILLGLILGISLFIGYEDLHIGLIGLLVFILSLLFFIKNSDLYYISLAIFLGFFLGSFRLDSYNLTERDKADVEILVLEKRSANDGFRYTVDFRSEGYEQKAFIFSKNDFSIGDMIKTQADISLLNKNTNPNLFNFRSYGLSKGVVSELKIDDEEDYFIKRSRSPLLALRRVFDSYIRDIFTKNLSKDSADFVISVVLAENLIEKDQVSKLGLSHILAVSGLHMDLLLGFTIYLLKKLRICHPYAMGLALGLSLVYAYVIGFAFSIVRVLIINTIAYLGFIYKRPVDRTKSLLIAALFILLINPFAILNSGFVLSFTACLSIYKIYPSFKRLFKEGFLRDRVSFIVSIQLSTLPFSLYYFRYFNLLSILANFLIVPVFTWAMYLVFGLIFLYPIFRIFLGPGFFLLDILISGILDMTRILGKVDLFAIDFSYVPFIVATYMYMLIFIFANIKERKYLDKFILVNLLLVSLSTYRTSPRRELSYEMVDIGQGDAFLINDRGSYYMLDVGGPIFKSYSSGEKILVPYLKSLGIRDFEAIFISHEDKDHSGNLDIILDNFEVKNIITSKNVSEDFLKYQPVFMGLGDRVNLSEGFIECVYDKDSADENDKSLGLLINIRGVRILSLGDLSSARENDLAIRADILKVSHHGSKSSSSKDFVKNTDPKISLISAGRNNLYGHPAPEVLDNLQGTKIYNSQVDGNVKIYFKKKLRIRKYLEGGFFK